VDGQGSQRAVVPMIMMMMTPNIMKNVNLLGWRPVGLTRNDVSDKHCLHLQGGKNMIARNNVSCNYQPYTLNINFNCT
jgi:hypothetical protein